MTPAEAAQEGTEGGGRLHRTAGPAPGACAQGIGVVDAVGAGERGRQQQARVVYEAVVVEGDSVSGRGYSLLASHGCSLAVA